MSIFLGGYYTAVDSRQYTISDCASELIKALGRVDIDGREPPLSKSNIVFVCHSLGGVVTRYMLDAYRSDFEEKRVGLCLFASPSLGSDYANTFSGLIRFYKNKIGEQLSFGSPLLDDLDERFIRYLEKRPPGSFVGAEAIEHHPPFLSWLPGFKPVVSKLSAGRYFSDRRTIPGTTHASIVKPNGRDHPSHHFLLDFVSTHFPRKHGAADAQDLRTKRQLKPTDVLFDAYEVEFEKYYVKRALDSAVGGQASLHSVWVHGRSGMGKTCAIARFAIQTGQERVDVCLSQWQEGATRESLISEFVETLIQRKMCSEDTGRTFSALVLALSLVGPELVVIFDEVPAENGKSGVATELLRLLTDVLVALKGRGQCRVQFLVCSLAAPIIGETANPAKTAELFGFIGAKDWSDEELRDLHAVIENELSVPADLDRCIAAADGSPRALKLLFRNLITNPDGAAGLDSAIAATRSQLGF